MSTEANRMLLCKRDAFILQTGLNILTTVLASELLNEGFIYGAERSTWTICRNIYSHMICQRREIYADCATVYN